MTANGWLQIAIFALAVLLVTKPLGLYLVAVYDVMQLRQKIEPDPTQPRWLLTEPGVGYRFKAD
jgi:hypothetical protein